MKTYRLPARTAAVFAALTASVCAAEPLAEVAGFSSLKIDQAKLEKGDIVSARSPGVTFPRGQSIESVFVVAAPYEKTIETLKTWNGGKQADKVYLHVDIDGAPDAADFKKLGAAPSSGPVKAFVSATGKGQVQLAAGEAAQAPAKAEGGSSPAFTSFWSGVLTKHAQAYVGGGLPGLPPYDIAGQKIAPAEEASALLKSVPKIQAQFKPALAAVGISGKPSKASLYWELVNAQGTATANLGAAVVTTAGKGTQMADVQYYASGTYYTFITLYQLWPTSANGKPATLIWRGDLISAAELGRLRGIERNAAGSAMAKEIVKTIASFQKDAAR
jgi:hypothetical protein